LKATRSPREKNYVAVILLSPKADFDDTRGFLQQPLSPLVTDPGVLVQLAALIRRPETS